MLIWASLALALCVPLVVAGTSPLLQWREPVYIAAGFAGVVGLLLLLIQPMLAKGYLPGLNGIRGRRIHRWIGAALTAAVLIHVVGLWVTSPPDVIDVLLFRSPTPFSIWGVVAMWAVLVTALLALLRRRLRISPNVWQLMHTALAAIIVIGTVVHAMLIEGTMGPLSKAVFCALVIGATGKTIADTVKRRRTTART